MAELHDVKDFPSAVSDEDFPEVMPMRKGENRFVVSKKKDRSLTSPNYKSQVAADQTNNANFVPFVPFPPGYFSKMDDTDQSNGQDSPVKAYTKPTNSENFNYTSEVPRSHNQPTDIFHLGLKGCLLVLRLFFFAYTGFDSVTSTAEEVKNPQRDLPIGIGFAMSLCCTLYMLVSAVIVGLVPYYTMDPDTPISSAFASHGIKWAAYVITIGSCTALCSSLMGSLLPQSRILMAMVRDGLLPSFFSDVNKSTRVAVKSTIVTGLVATLLAFFMDVEQLSGMVSLGTLVAYTVVAISVLVLRYVPPDKVPFPSSFQQAIDSVSLRHTLSYSHGDTCSENTISYATTSERSPLLVMKEATVI